MSSTTQDFTKKVRAWCFTSFNFTGEELTKFLGGPSSYIVVGEEACPETGKRHYQGYVEYKNARYFPAVKKLLGDHVHLEPRKGSAAQAADYCKKEGTFHEVGKMSQPQGARNDVAFVKDLIEEGHSFEEIADRASSYQSLKIAQLLLPYKEKKRNWHTVIRWYYGVSGAGKTYAAFNNHPDERVYFHTGTDEWWQGYDGHPIVIIDDFRSDFCTFPRFLHLTQEYPCGVMCKGGSRQFIPKIMYFTSPDHPESYFRDQPENMEQVIRRIDEIRYFDKKYIAPKKECSDACAQNTPDASP